jgi:hypothetical protein
MTYNSKHERTDRSLRRTKRRTKLTRPEKKSPLMYTFKREHPTKPKNHKKIAKVKARRGQYIKDAIDYAANDEEPDYERLAPQIVVTWYNIQPWMEDFNPADGTFSICDFADMDMVNECGRTPATYSRQWLKKKKRICTSEVSIFR